MTVRKIPLLSKKQQTRFWNKVLMVANPNECWAWTAGLVKGYGSFGVGSSTFRANRISFYLSTGIDPGPLLVRHLCNNPGCVRPTHLDIGTPADNMRDKSEAGNCPQGAGHYFAKLTEDQALAVFRRSNAGEAPRDLAAEFNISMPTVSSIKHGRTWKHLHYPLTSVHFSVRPR